MPPVPYAEYVGGASGAALGYILADSPVAGYNVGVNAVRGSRKIAQMAKAYLRRRRRVGKPYKPRRAMAKSKPKKQAGMKKLIALEKKNIKGDDIHSGVSGDVVFVKIGSQKYKKGRGAPIKLLSQSSYLCSTTAGSQNVRYLSVKGTTQDWLSTVTDVSNGHVTQGGWFAADPFQKSTGSEDVSGNVVLPAGSLKTQSMVHCEDVTSLMINNATTIGQYHDIYVIECIKNCNQDPVVIWNDGLNRQGMGLGSIAPPSAGGVGPIAGGYLNAGIVGTYPTEVREFRKFFKIRKVKKIFLAAGATEEIKFVVKINQTYTREYIQKLQDELITIPKGAYFVLDVCHATPVLDVTDGARQVTYGPVEYLVLNTTTTHLRSTPVTKKNAVTYGLSYVAAGANTTNSKQITVVDTATTVNNL